MKRCCTCKSSLSLTEFYRNRSRRDGLGETCKKCTKARARAWELNNPERVVARRQTSANKRKANARAARWYEANKERVRLRPKDKEKIRTRDQARQRTPRRKAKKTIYRLNRRGRMAAALCTLTLAQWEAILALFNNACAYCGVQNIRLEREHKIPVSRGGATTAENIVPACRSCNAKKGTRLPEEMN